MILALFACGGEVQSPLAADWPAIPVQVTAKVEVPAKFPTDLLVRPDGTVWVLDGYRSAIVPISNGTPGAPLTGDWGHPVRMADAGDGEVWLVDPAGRMVEIDGGGAVRRVLPLAGTGDYAEGGPPAGPVAALEDGSAVIVADRHGRIVWVDPANGAVLREAKADGEDHPLGTITDLVRAPDGGFYAADAVGGRVHHLAPNGDWRSFGRYGLWVGTMKQPKAVAPFGDGTLVVDSELGAVQLFGADGSARGALALDGAPLALEHPIAVEVTAAGEVLVLDSATATLWALSLDAAAVAASLAEAPPRWQRKALVAAAEGAAGKDGENCRQCHDGLVNDSRMVWDAALGHHPLHEKPEEPLPAFFSLDAEGGLACATCHSPHGASTLADVAAVGGDADRDLLVRHAAEEPFMRMSRKDSALCVACHTDDPHGDAAVAKMGFGGGAHPVGAELARRMKDRPDAASQQCLACHAVHGADGDPLMRGEADGRLCANCHESESEPKAAHPTGLTGAPSQPGPSLAAHLPLDPGGRATCRTCHDLAGGRGEALLRLPEDGGTLCAACHADQAEALAFGHGGVDGSNGIACLGCHDTHEARVPDHLLRGFGASTAADPNGCLGCHRPGGSGAAAGVVRGGHPVDGMAHEELEGQALTCATCHDPHGPKDDLPACGECHTEPAAAAQRGGHGKATCLDCHPAHEDPPVAALAGANPNVRGCMGCHLDGRDGSPKLAAWEHPDLVFKPDGTRWTPLAGLPLYGPDGAVLPNGQNGELTCASCHETHGPNAAEPGDKLRRPGWKEVCTSCHGTDALVLYRYFHQPDRRGSAGEGK